MSKSNLNAGLARQLVNLLPESSPELALFNPWRDHCELDTEDNGPEQRIERLACHLNCNPKFILVGEAPGYQGCRYSGIAFTSERLLMEGRIPRIAPISQRLTKRKQPFSEPSAKIVWDNLYPLGIADCTILWNALQLHPYDPKHQNMNLSNRTPTSKEIKKGRESLCLLIDSFPDAKVIAVGKKAQGLLDSAGIKTIGCARHPAYGGASQFGNDLKGLVGKTSKEHR